VAVIAVALAATVASAGALQLYESYGVRYVKHVNFNTESRAKTQLTIRNAGMLGYARVQVKFSARALDGSNVGGSTFVDVNPGQTKTLWLYHSKPITDLNFLQLIAQSRNIPW